MQSGEHGVALLQVVLPSLAERLLDQRGMIHVGQRGLAPTHAHQRRAAAGRHVPRRAAAKHRPAIDGGRRSRPRRPGEPREPGHRVAVLVEPRDLPAADAQLRPGLLPFQGHQLPLRLLRRTRFQPARGHGQSQRRLEPPAAVRRIVQPPQRQRPGQRQTVIQIVEAQEEGRLVTGAGMEIAPRNLGQLPRVAGRHRLVQHPLRPGATVQLVQVAARRRHLAQQPLRLGLHAAMDRRACRAGKVVVRRFQDLIQALDGVAVMALLQPLPRLGHELRDGAIGREEEVVDQLLAVLQIHLVAIDHVPPEAVDHVALGDRRAGGQQDRRPQQQRSRQRAAVGQDVPDPSIHRVPCVPPRSHRREPAVGAQIFEAPQGGGPVKPRPQAGNSAD